MKKPDLSQRQIGAIPRQAFPSFRNRSYSQGSATGSADLFIPNCSCSVLWALIQLQGAATIQFLLNNVPVGMALNLNSGAIVRFPSTYMVNNEKLSLAVTGGVTFSYEVAWVKDFVSPLPLNVIEVSNPSSGGGGANQNVNIFDSSGQELDSDGAGDLGVAIHDSGGGSINSTSNALWTFLHDSFGNPYTQGNPLPIELVGSGDVAAVDAAGRQLVTGQIQPLPSATSTAPASTAVVSTAGGTSLLAANTSRLEAIIVNIDVVTIYLALGGTPTAAAYHVALQPCTAANDGTGGVFITDVWNGAIKAIAASGTGHVAVTELTA